MLSNWFSKFWLSVVNSMVTWKPQSRARVARLMAWIFWHCVSSRRKVTLRNLELCFPDWSQEKRIAVAKDCFYKLSRAALDHSVLWKGSAGDIRKFVRFNPEELARVTEEANRPLMIIAPHFAGLDAAGIGFNLHVRGISLYQTQSNPVWDKAALDGRKRFADPILIAKSSESDLRPIIRGMKEGLPFYYLPDMDHGRKNSIFVPFFGVPAATLPMASRIAKLTRAKVLMCIPEMVDDGYEIHLTEFFDDFPTVDYEADTRRVTEVLESWILKFPEQYMWTHRRFKTRPEGEKSVY